MANEEDVSKAFEEAQQEKEPTEGTEGEEKKDVKAKKVSDSQIEERMKKLEFILDIPLKVSVELGRTKMVVNDLLKLGQGSVIELHKLAGEPMEVLVNEKLVARGEVVVVNERFGVRLTDIISPIERIEQLK